ncbi:unnamed protein product [Hermetia illucens]|uniref:Uncharacterized protein n=1 Tax=Hermetia illucens TaxID=343691 RepID=A0A7R8YMU4_HERIL|nr:unnamed protein product [Hermetia illucens]
MDKQRRRISVSGAFGPTAFAGADDFFFCFSRESENRKIVYEVIQIESVSSWNLRRNSGKYQICDDAHRIDQVVYWDYIQVSTFPVRYGVKCFLLTTVTLAAPGNTVPPVLWRARRKVGECRHNYVILPFDQMKTTNCK